MKKTLKNLLLPFTFGVALCAPQAYAQSDSTNTFLTADYSLEDRFHGGEHEVSTGAGVLFGPFLTTRGRPTVDYAFGNAQLGFMINDVCGGGILRGNFEVVPEAFGSGIFGGHTGTYIAGGTVWFRYNFVQPRARIIPYFQLGGGWTFMDIDHRYDGENYNFNLGATAGLRYFIKPQVSINLEYRYQHISNADLWQHNLGLNSDGPVLGVSWFF